MENSKLPIGPGFKKTDLEAGMRIRFPYQDQQFTGTIDGFNIVEGREILYVDGIAYRYSDMELKPTYTILTYTEIKPEVEKPKKVKKEKKVGAKKPDFKLVKKLAKKQK